MPGRPIKNQGVNLTVRQRDLVFASALADGWLEKQSGGVNVRLGFEQSQKKNLKYFAMWWTIMKIWIFERVKRTSAIPPGSKKVDYKLRARTINHPVFTFYHNAMCRLIPSIEEKTGKERKIWVKYVPTYDFLMQHLTFYVSTTHTDIICQDGSKKSSESKGMEIHFSSYQYDGQARLCVALYDKFGIKAHPNTQNIKGKTMYSIYISGLSNGIIRNKVKPLMHPSMHYKVPHAHKDIVKHAKNPQSGAEWRSFYKTYKYSNKLNELI